MTSDTCIFLLATDKVNDNRLLFQYLCIIFSWLRYSKELASTKEMAQVFDPYAQQSGCDFFKQVAIEKIIQDVEHEIQWRLVDQECLQQGDCVRVFAIKNGDELKVMHAPYCRCSTCPLNSQKKWTDARKRSPFGALNIESDHVYQDAQASFHMIFCQCPDCYKDLKQLMIRQSRRIMKHELENSTWTGVEIYTESPEQLQNYKKLVVENAVFTILTDPSSTFVIDHLNKIVF